MQKESSLTSKYSPANNSLIANLNNTFRTNTWLKSDFSVVILIASITIALTLLWFSFDHHLPAQDEAEHIMNSLRFRELLLHCRPWRHQWWYQCLTVNGFYPPFVYFVNGCFLLIFGQSRFIEQLAMSFFTALATVSTYAITRLLHGTRQTAFFASFCLYFYPVISTLSHTFLLDLPAVAMTAFALMALLWWRSFPTPTWQRTILTALALGIACLSKQLVAVSLVPLAFYFFIIDLKQAWQKQKPNWLIHIIVIGLITIAISLPFVIINQHCLAGMNQSFLEAIAAKQEHISYLQKLLLYVQLLPQQMSSFLLILFLLSLIFLPKQKHTLLVPLAISAIGGFALTCTSAWAGLLCDQRYTAPFLIAPAVYSAFFLNQLLTSPKRLFKFSAAIVIAISGLNYLFFNFVPYPLPLAHLPWQYSLSDHDGNPAPVSDWGQAFVLQTIERRQGNNTEYLNILTNSIELNPHTFELLLKEKNNTKLIPTSSRSWTIIGDKVDFSPQTALNYQWYLVKSGSSGYSFHDQNSLENYKRLIDFISRSDKYILTMQKTLPDKTTLKLYHRTY